MQTNSLVKETVNEASASKSAGTRGEQRCPLLVRKMVQAKFVLCFKVSLLFEGCSGTKKETRAERNRNAAK
jgi:hypothetical protein